MADAALPVYFISHGGGPWPWMRDQMGGTYDKLADSLARMPAQMGARPRAVLMVSAHWEAPAFTVMTHEHPPMVYDYGGFPEHTYRIHYPAPGAPAGLAQRVHQMIEAAGLPAALDGERGFDHGAFSPLAVIYPQADVPVFQLSLRRGLDPAEHLALGRALAPLRREGVAIIGSGLSYHNLRAFGQAGGQASRAFDGWLQQSLIGTDAQTRDAALLAWAEAPAARMAHPREEHLLPLMVAAGAAGEDAASCVSHEDAFMGALTVSSFRFG